MKHVFSTAIALCAFSFSAADANAQMSKDNWPYWYLAVHGDISYIPDTDLTVGGAKAGTMALKNDFTIGGAVGYRPHTTKTFLDHTRYEVEYTYRAHSFDRLDTGAGSIEVDGSMRADVYMLNAYYDMPTNARLSPYVGAGIGVAKWTMDSGTLSVDDKDTQLAYQFMVGMSYSPRTLPNVDWGMGYRYFTSMDPSFKNNAAQTVDYSIDTHSLELSGRFHF